MPQPRPGLMRSHRSDFAGVYRQPASTSLAKLRLAFGGSVAEEVARLAMNGEGYPYPALRLARNLSTSACGTWTTFVDVSDRQASRLQTKCDAEIQLRALR